MGEAMDDMASAWGGTVRCVRCGTLERAVAQAGREAREGDKVVLSPGCASFDQFESFEQRGRRFVDAVAQWAREESTCPSNPCGTR
jgi:UDP-N-acetylmuramoylalanine--D-glutamate ligase